MTSACPVSGTRQLVPRIAAQADGTRYLSKDQPPAVLNAWTPSPDQLAAPLYAQRVIEPVLDDGMVTALKHGGRGTDVGLHLDWCGPGLTLHVVSAVASGIASGEEQSGGPSPRRNGRGLPGMREPASSGRRLDDSGPES